MTDNEQIVSENTDKQNTAEEPVEYKARFVYKKEGVARYIAHLDTIDVISKAMRRVGMPYAVTQGCHIRPKLTFGSPLPLGHASHCEYFIVALTEIPDMPELLKDLNAQLPRGMEIVSGECPMNRKKSPPNGERVTYKLWFKQAETAKSASEFLLNPETEFETISKGKPRAYKLGNAVLKLDTEKSASDTILRAEFVQGLPDVPSVSKIITALASFLGDRRDDLQLLERIAVKEINQETNS